ncbi:MobF family relaxase [Chroococcus sp. FPU101]|uniref:MobF family relaxase n=1 Tax=Chroococcus sp. FPU101 TaxID=1974212 RepID=UPI001A8DB7DE|nr:MobF family relaxase [Chroococcus sp. FPU101]GFE71721.1 conjugative relaxase domain protein [Chroococcus sp. FPU101]
MVATVGRCYTNPKDYAQDNYYTQGDNLANSEWLGKAALSQNLSGQIQESHFLNAYQSLDPNGQPLRRQQNYSQNSKRHNRPGTDVTLSAPKSISVAALVFKEQEILEAHQAAVRSTMEYVEKNCIYYQTKQNTSKLLLQSHTAQIATFHHDDNRNKDPQLHSHCVILNQTLCPDGVWRAVANHELYIQQKTIGAYYAHELARQLKQKGWNIEWTDDHTFELAGVNKDRLDALFSTRSNQIEAELAQLGLTRATATAEQKQALCLKTRPEKKHNHHPEDRERQLEYWQQKAKEAGIQISKDSRKQLEQTYYQPSPNGSPLSLIESALFILTERQTAFYKHELLKECLRQSQGSYDPIELQSEIEQYTALVPTQDGRLTTRQQLGRERKIIELAQAGRNSQSPLASSEQAQAIALQQNLNKGQGAALLHMATSSSAVVLVQGNAGVGKTYTMRAFKNLIGEQPLRGLAPSAAAADVLQTESEIPSQTLASYLLTPNEKLPHNEILLVDEAGMLSTLQMEQLLELAQANNNRIILVGDTKQLSAVSSGAPFKLLQERGLPTAVIDQNLRQRDPNLKQVVDLMANHDKDESSVNQAYQKLYNQDKIKQIVAETERIFEIANDYLNRPNEVRERTLILAGTNTDRQEIAKAVRQGLINSGALDGESLTIQTLRRKDIDKFAISQAHHYQRGDIIKFQTENAQFSKDCFYRVTDVNPENNTLTLIDTIGADYSLSLNKYKQREVYQVQLLEIRRGEQMRFTKNIRTKEHQQLNGQRFTVEGITEDGQITIQTKGKTLTLSPSQLLHSDYRYVDTVHSSQGQTADYCIYSASNAKSLTIGRESFYVAASRAKQEFVVYTASVQDLGVTVQLSRKNENALDLVDSSRRKIEAHQENTSPQLQERKRTDEKEKSGQPINQPVTSSHSHQLSNPPENQFIHPSISADEPSTQKSQLTDALLLSHLRSVEQWKKTCPPEPSLHKGKSLKKRIDELNQLKARKEKQLKIEQQELKELGQPRSLLNPFGVRAEVIEEKQYEISLTRMAQSDIGRQISQAEADFKAWQQKARAYLTWLKDAKTQEMQQLAEQLESPDVQKQLGRIKEGYAIYEAAKSILNREGTQSQEGRVFQGKRYRVEERGDTLRIFSNDSPHPLFLATDLRKAGGIIEISQFDLTQEDKEIIQGYAKALEKQHKAENKPKKQLER